MCIAYHHELDEMDEDRVEADDFIRIYNQLANGQYREHYNLRAGFLIIYEKVCVTKKLMPKALFETHGTPYVAL